jgi:hypothetical protein
LRKFHPAGSFNHFSPFGRLAPEQFMKRFICRLPSQGKIAFSDKKISAAPVEEKVWAAAS